MVDLEYVMIGTPQWRIVEECGEILKAVGKGERFGWLNCHPGQDTTNLENLNRELEDLAAAIADLESKVYQGEVKE